MAKTEGTTQIDFGDTRIYGIRSPLHFANYYLQTASSSRIQKNKALKQQKALKYLPLCFSALFNNLV